MDSKIVCFGDSITAGSRTSDNPMGIGYVSMLNSMLPESQVLSGLEIINSGVNGHTVQDLLIRYQKDVVQHEPQFVTIKIGINDAYHEFISDDKRYRLEQYERDYQKLISLIQRELPEARIFLFTPYFIADNREEPLYQIMSRYIQVVYGLGKEFGLAVLDIQKVFDKAVLRNQASYWAADQIHPIPEGHRLIAYRVLEFLENNIS
ncbi:MAG: hypothetical protein K9N35_02075 [Candidatus Marinimicrobia bacterium]|nr:hypothetical protein [Candidatus Neomarinimicrobiota bacterium]